MNVWMIMQEGSERGGLEEGKVIKKYDYYYILEIKKLSKFKYLNGSKNTRHFENTIQIDNMILQHRHDYISNTMNSIDPCYRIIR